MRLLVVLCKELIGFFHMNCILLNLYFEAIKSEYTNAQLECNAADERAKLLASEVIGLEEKVLIFLGIFAICTFEDKVFPVFFFFFFFLKSSC